MQEPWVYDRGPASTCPQSIGIPPSSTFPPPPHLRPFITAMRPQVALSTRVGRNPRETSTPVAGQVRCVERLSGAVGLPSLASSSCSCWVRYPDRIRTSLPVSCSKSAALSWTRRITEGTTCHSWASTQWSRPRMTSLTSLERVHPVNSGPHPRRQQKGCTLGK